MNITTQCFYSRQHYTGGRTFLYVNLVNKTWHIGNTASTAVSHHHADLSVYDLRQREIKDMAQRLTDVFDFKEYSIKWDKDFDTYGDINKQLLTA